MATTGEPQCPRCGDTMLSGLAHMDCKPRPTQADYDSLAARLRESEAKAAEWERAFKNLHASIRGE